MGVSRCGAHVAACCDCNDVGVLGEFLERDGAMHAATGVSVMMKPDKFRHIKLRSGARVSVVLLDVGNNGQDVEYVPLPSAHAHNVTI